MKKTDLKIGYVVEIREGTLYMVMPSRYVDNKLVIVNGVYWMSLNQFNNDLTSTCFNKHDIVKVYGFTNIPSQATVITTDGRELLWEREKPKKKMTVAEVESILGYGIEIVSEK